MSPKQHFKQFARPSNFRKRPKCTKTFLNGFVMWKTKKAMEKKPYSCVQEGHGKETPLMRSNRSTKHSSLPLWEKFVSALCDVICKSRSQIGDTHLVPGAERVVQHLNVGISPYFERLNQIVLSILYNNKFRSMPSLSTSPRRRRDGTKSKFKVVGKYDEFLSRIKKSLYYGKLPTTDRFSLPVTELAAELFSEVKNGQSLERLDLEEAAAMSRNACVSPCSLVLALLYLERLKSCNPDYLQRVAPSELFLVSMMVASKFLHDDGEADEVFNDEWAASAGLSAKQVNRFERDFLQAIEWEVFVSEQTFWKRLIRMERDVALKEGKRRGWFSYSDLENLLDTVDFSALAQTVITVSAVCLTSYTASVLTLIGSAFIVSQIPGIPISSSVSSTCNISRTVPQEMPVTNSLEDPTLQVSPSVGVLTSFILASLSSCHSENASITPGFTFGNDKSSACTCPHCPVRNVNIPNGQLIGWTETVLEYLNWQWWQIELKQLFHNHLNDTSKSEVQELTQRKHRKYRADDDAANHSELDSHSRRDEKQSNARDGSQDFIVEVQNWLDQAALERSSHTNFFPLKITSNY